jgi:hypothetical protein
MNGDDFPHKRNEPRISLDLSQFPNSKHFLTFTTGPQGTVIYRNGRPVRSDPDLVLRMPEGVAAGRFVLGNSVSGKNSWQGEIFGFAAYPFLLGQDQIQSHYREWQPQEDFSFARMEGPFLLYRLNGREGNRARDDSGFGRDLLIPPRFAYAERLPFQGSFQDLVWNRSLAFDVVLNLLGFMPLGFAGAATLSHSKFGAGLKSMLLVVAFCFITSLLIEFLQSWMPTRNSSGLDLLLNTIGAFLGWVCLRFARCRISPTS